MDADAVRQVVPADDHGGKRTISMPGEQFIARLLQHVLHGGFKRIRHYGLLAPCANTERPAQARRLLAMPAAIEQCRSAALGGHVLRCDGCGTDQVSYNSCRNLLSNAFKFTHHQTAVNLIAYEIDDRLYIDVEDRCGGLAADAEQTMFGAFAQLGMDRTGLGLGLTIARQNVESMGGTLTAKNLPDVGCIFTIGFPNSTVERRSDFVTLG